MDNILKLILLLFFVVSPMAGQAIQKAPTGDDIAILGSERRQERREGRQDRRDERREERQDRRDERHGEVHEEALPLEKLD